MKYMYAVHARHISVHCISVALNTPKGSYRYCCMPCRPLSSYDQWWWWWWWW